MYIIFGQIKTQFTNGFGQEIVAAHQEAGSEHGLYTIVSTFDCFSVVECDV
jgi:hypothetical protein